jgi:hypothetical protein
LRNAYSIQNSIYVTTDLQSTEINEGMRMCSFDIQNTSIDIPKSEVINIAENMTQNIPEIKNLKEIINILKVVMKQNYSQFDQQILQTN